MWIRAFMREVILLQIFTYFMKAFFISHLNIYSHIFPYGKHDGF